MFDTFEFNLYSIASPVVNGLFDLSVIKVNEKLKEQSNDIYATPYEVVTTSTKAGKIDKLTINYLR